MVMDNIFVMAYLVTWFNVDRKVNKSILLTYFSWSLWFISIHLAHSCRVLIANFEQVFAHCVVVALVSLFSFCKFNQF